MKKTKKQVRKVNKKQESGRSMIEMVGVLAVMGLITAGAFVLISSAMSSQRISRVDDDVSALVQGVRLLYNSNNNFNGLTDDALKVLAFSDVKNPFGGVYHVVTTDLATATQSDARFKIVITGLGEANATALAGRKWSGAAETATCGSYSNNTFTAQSSCSSTAKDVAITYGKDAGIAL